MFDVDLQRRVQRLIRGERRVDDLDRIFLGLRDHSQGRASIREIGDFVAHRQQREKGPVTQVVRDIFESCHLWLRCHLGHLPTIQEVRKVSAANLRIATDEQITARLGLRRAVAKSVLTQALCKIERGKKITDRERHTLNYLGGAFIWNPAFTDAQVVDDLWHILIKLGLVSNADRPAFEMLSTFIALYVVALMHGSTILLNGSGRADLQAGFGNHEERLEVKALIDFTDMVKPILAPICIFWTRLHGPNHCVLPLLCNPKGWAGPLEIDRDGKLAPM